MLINCPECELQVSDKALSCPHCGFPLKTSVQPRKTSSTKHKRLPNGFGQIIEIKGKNLRNPYRAMVTVGKTDAGRPICKILKPQGYFRTYNEAYEALVEYNKNPYDLDADITVEQLYKKWTEYYFKNIKDSSVRTITSAWNYCSSLKNMRAKDLRARHIKNVMETGTFEGKTASANTQSRIKSLFNLMLDYALEYELVDRNFARTFNVSDDIINEMESAHRGHIVFTDEEMTKLWANTDVPYVNIILIQCYMGWRPQELGLLEINKVDLVDRNIIGGIKTEAGTDRVVPIHDCIYDMVKELYHEAQLRGSKYLINCFDGNTHRENFRLTYDKYANRFAKVVSVLELNPEHRPHDPRKQFTSMCKKYNVDEYAIKYMVGHSISDITEKVYTTRPKDWLNEEIKKIKKEY